MSPCEFCARAAIAPQLPGGVILEDGGFQATHWLGSDRPVYLGQLIVQSVRHVPTLADLSDEEAHAFGRVVIRLSRGLRAATRAELVYLYGFQEIVRHVHLFLTARYPGTPVEYIRLAVTDWPAAPRGSEEDVARLCERIRSELAV
jgi:histidine triad (HIT) family protein